MWVFEFCWSVLLYANGDHLKMGTSTCSLKSACLWLEIKRSYCPLRFCCLTFYCGISILKAQYGSVPENQDLSADPWTLNIYNGHNSWSLSYLKRNVWRINTEKLETSLLSLHQNNCIEQTKDALKWPINFIPEMTHGATLRSLYLYNWTIKGLKMKIPKEKFLKNQKTKTLRYLYYFLSYRHANSGEETNMKSAFPQLLTDTFNAFNSRSTIHIVIMLWSSSNHSLPVICL